MTHILVYAFLFVTYVLASTVGLLMVKGAVRSVRLTPLQEMLVSSVTWQLLLGCGFYGLSFILWIDILTRLPLSIASPWRSG